MNGLRSPKKYIIDAHIFINVSPQNVHANYVLKFRMFPKEMLAGLP